MKALVFSTGGAHLTTMLGMVEELFLKGELNDIDSFAGISAGAILAAFAFLLRLRRFLRARVHG